MAKFTNDDDKLANILECLKKCMPDIIIKADNADEDSIKYVFNAERHELHLTKKAEILEEYGNIKAITDAGELKVLEFEGSGKYEFQYLLEIENLNTKPLSQSLKYESTTNRNWIIHINHETPPLPLLINNLVHALDKSLIVNETLEYNIYNLINKNFICMSVEIDEDDLDIANKVKNNAIVELSFRFGYKINDISANFNKDIDFKYFDIPQIPQKLPICELEEPLLFFMLAEKIQYPNFKFIEYYHIIEYFFHLNTKNEILKAMQDFMISEKWRNQNSKDFMDGLYDTVSTIAEQSLEGGREKTLIQKVFSQLIGYDTLAEAIDSIGVSEVENALKQNKHKLKEYVVSLKTVAQKDNPRVKCLDYNNDDEKNNLCIAYANRIYRTRNTLVHTRKGDDTPYIFKYEKTQIESLHIDIKIIRFLAKKIIEKSAVGLIRL
jgi:hypothetical protein